MFATANVLIPRTAAKRKTHNASLLFTLDVLDALLPPVQDTDQEERLRQEEAADEAECCADRVQADSDSYANNCERLSPTRTDEDRQAAWDAMGTGVGKYLAEQSDIDINALPYYPKLHEYMEGQRRAALKERDARERRTKERERRRGARFLRKHARRRRQAAHSLAHAKAVRTASAARLRQRFTVTTARPCSSRAPRVRVVTVATPVVASAESPAGPSATGQDPEPDLEPGYRSRARVRSARTTTTKKRRGVSSRRRPGDSSLSGLGGLARAVPTFTCVGVALI